MRLFLLNFVCLSLPAFSQELLIISAMPSELQVIEKISSNKKEVKKEWKLQTKQGQFKNLTLLTSLVGPGKVNAAMNTQRLITEFKPQAIIFTGVAGGINPEYKVGDLVVATSVFQHDYGFLSPLGIKTRAIGTMPEVGLGTGEESFYQNLENSPMAKVFKKSLANIEAQFKEVQVNNGSTKPRLFFGRIATGDQFVAFEEKKKELLNLGADAVEMEGASVCYVAQENNLPCYLIRAISDSAGEDAVSDFPAFFSAAAENNTIILKAILSGKELSQVLK